MVVTLYFIIINYHVLPRDAYQGALSEEEMAALEKAAREKATALSTIEAREKEIRAIRDGQLTSKKVTL